MGSPEPAVTHSDPEVDATVRLLHRRRGWVWTTVISVVAWLVACGLLGSLAPNASGTGLALSAIFILLLTLFGLGALVASVIDTVRLHRLDGGVRRQAVRRTRHYPVRAHAYSYPPRHRFSWVFGWVMMVILLCIGVVSLPGLVDGVAYLAGAESSSTFLPVSYGQACGRGGCSTVTYGVLANGANVTWPDQVPLGKAIAVRQPLWNWGFGSQMIDGNWSAVGTIFAGLLFSVFGVFVVIHAFKLARRWLRHRQLGQQMAGVTRLPGRPGLDATAELGRSSVAPLEAPPALDPPGGAGRLPGGGVGRLALHELAAGVTLDDHVERLGAAPGRRPQRLDLADDVRQLARAAHVPALPAVDDGRDQAVPSGRPLQ